MTAAKAQKYARLAKALRGKARLGKPAHLADLRRLVGSIESTAACVDHARLRSNWLRWCLREAVHSPTNTCFLPDEAFEELQWFATLPQRPHDMVKSFLTPKTEKLFLVETDWSGLGVAACWVDECRNVLDTAHNFVAAGSDEHSNEGELRGILENTHSLVVEHDWRDGRVFVRNDNITGCSYINKRGGRFAHLFVQLNWFFLAWQQRNLLVSAEWIAGVENFNAASCSVARTTHRTGVFTPPSSTC